MLTDQCKTHGILETSLTPLRVGNDDILHEEALRISVAEHNFEFDSSS